MRAFLLLVCLSVSACTTSPTPPPSDRTANLLKHPEFQAAAKAAPDFTRQCLRTITDLESQLQQAQSK